MEKNSKFNKRKAFNKAVGPGKNPKLINVGHMFILDYRVLNKKILQKYPRFMIKSGFKSRVGNNGTRTVSNL